jgi:hypothetical protein
MSATTMPAAGFRFALGFVGWGKRQLSPFAMFSALEFSVLIKMPASEVLWERFEPSNMLLLSYRSPCYFAVALLMLFVSAQITFRFLTSATESPLGSISLA